jgi:hypothetical protein
MLRTACAEIRFHRRQLKRDRPWLDLVAGLQSQRPIWMTQDYPSIRDHPTGACQPEPRGNQPQIPLR